LEKAVVLVSKETGTFLSHKNIFTYAFVSVDDYPKKYSIKKMFISKSSIGD
jgi:hypothetical protein